MSNNSSAELLPGKYKNLIQAEAAGLVIPRSLWLSDSLLASPSYFALLKQFIAESPKHSRYIVRSAHSEEDGSTHSFAGHFWSSSAVSAAQLADTVGQAIAENRDVLEHMGLTASPGLLVQEYIEHHLGGVMFTPWSFFSGYWCLNYSTVSVQEAVEGKSQTAVLALDAKADSPLPLPDELVFLLPMLRAACQGLLTVFDFAVDCEWVYSKQKQTLVILQVRPQTHAIGPILPLPLAQKLDLPPGHWQFTALSESLGRLSPLSFSLLQRLYTDAIPVLRRLGVQAKRVDFLWRQPDGSVLVDPHLEQACYAPTLFGGFWRSFREHELKSAAVAAIQHFEPAESFSYTTLAELFSYWMIANIYSEGAGRAIKPVVHAYELSWYSTDVVPASYQQPTDAASASWSGLNTALRVVFQGELNKLKRLVSANRPQVFCEWDEYQRADFTAAQQRESEQAALALYDYACAVSGAGDTDLHSLSVNSVARGQAFVVHHPGGERLNIPVGSILFAPYFDNRWVTSIVTLKGIVVAQGSPLSHSAIVARECGVPYCVLASLDLRSVVTGMSVVLDPLKRSLVWQ